MSPTSQFQPYSPHVEPSPEAGRPAGRRSSTTGANVIARQAKELHALLRRRLLITVAVSVGFFGILPIRSVIQLYEPWVPSGARLVLLGQAVVAVTIAVLGAVIWKRPPKRLRHLRELELVVFAVIVAYLMVSNGYFVDRYGIMAPPIEALVHPLVSQGATRLDPVTLRWLVVIVGYGTLIPNTWRRCAIVVFSMVGIHLLQLVIQAIGAGVSLGEMTALMVYPVVWMTVGTVVAIFGSYRVSLLERRVQDAERLGQYRLTRHLGTGGMGEVYLAEHVLLKQPFAVKMLSPDRVSDPKILQRFEREVQAMARLEHWNTVEIYDYGHGADGSFYYVMEYLPGLTLEQLVAEYGPLPPARAVHFLRQVCRALAEAHDMGLMHRDIKPGNIIVCERAGIFDVAKLLDFGLVKHVGLQGDADLTLEGTVAGTPAYMSPEQAAGGDTTDARTDIYSLGAVAYFLLTGHPPFTNRSAMQIMAAHMYETPPPVIAYRPEAGAALDEIVRRCLAKKPSERYPDVRTLQRELEEWTAPDRSAWTQREARAWWTERETTHPVGHS
ncbi:MAG TPA: serine/threonine-protein kinase [Gemmatimonadaceae bacterium]|nr:serine/threonine-protein kinase [Gemmatimonadaceae bacterium]